MQYLNTPTAALSNPVMLLHFRDWVTELINRNAHSTHTESRNQLSDQQIKRALSYGAPTVPKIQINKQQNETRPAGMLFPHFQNQIWQTRSVDKTDSCSI